MDEFHSAGFKHCATPPGAAPSSGVDILAALKERTRSQHDSLEKRLNIVDRLASLSRYRQVLAAFYGFYMPLERRFMLASLAVPLRLDLGARQKSPLLVRDLVALGWPEESVVRVPHCSDLPATSSGAQIFGCAYVLEGATLGGQILARHLQRSLHVDVDHGGAFFNSYGERVPALWQAFRQALTLYVTDAALAEAVISAATETFFKLEAWLGQRLAGE